MPDGRRFAQPRDVQGRSCSRNGSFFSPRGSHFGESAWRPLPALSAIRVKPSMATNMEPAPGRRRPRQGSECADIRPPVVYRWCDDQSLPLYRLVGRGRRGRIPCGEITQPNRKGLIRHVLGILVCSEFSPRAHIRNGQIRNAEFSAAIIWLHGALLMAGPFPLTSRVGPWE
jgi:hypothetical protein